MPFAFFEKILKPFCNRAKLKINPKRIEERKKHMERRYKSGRKKRMRRGVLVLAILLVIAVLYVLISLWASAYFLTVRRFQVDLNNGGDPIRAVVI